MLRQRFVDTVKGLERIQEWLEDDPPSFCKSKPEREATGCPGNGFNIPKLHDASYGVQQL